jgi:hypothetical protein
VGEVGGTSVEGANAVRAARPRWCFKFKVQNSSSFVNSQPSSLAAEGPKSLEASQFCASMTMASRAMALGRFLIFSYTIVNGRRHPHYVTLI